MNFDTVKIMLAILNNHYIKSPFLTFKILEIMKNKTILSLILLGFILAGFKAILSAQTT